MPVSSGASDELIREDLQADYPTTDEDFARGWLASMFDTDGTFPEGKELGYCQYEGPIFDQVCEYLISSDTSGVTTRGTRRVLGRGSTYAWESNWSRVRTSDGTTSKGVSQADVVLRRER